MPSRITDHGVRAALSQKLRDLPLGMLAQLALFITSTTRSGQSEQHSWLGTSSSMREWIGRRLKQNPNAFNFAVVNKKFENSGNMPLDLLNNDKTNEAMLWMDDFLSSVPLWYEELVASTINNGESVNCFDGQFFFDTDHSYANSGTFSNDLTFDATDHTAITAEEAAKAINTAIETMRGFPDDHGRKIANRGMTAIDVIVQAGTVNSAAIRQAVTAEKVDTGSGSIDNPLRGQDVDIQIVTDGLITLGNTKMVVARSRRRGDMRARPFLFQENTGDSRIDVLGSDSEYATLEDAVGIFLKKVGNAGYGIPSHATLTTFN